MITFSKDELLGMAYELTTLLAIDIKKRNSTHNLRILMIRGHLKELHNAGL